MIFRKGKSELEKMRKANLIVAAVLQHLGDLIEPGVTTGFLDSEAEKLIGESGGSPAFKGYNGFPASVCTSINEEVVHGIPRNDRYLKNGDILAIDVGVQFQGFVGDAAKTFAVGEVSSELQQLMDVTQKSLYLGIEQAVLGNRVSDISAAVQEYVEAHGFSVVREFVGHGIGRSLHEDPQVPNFGKPGHGPRLVEGMVLAIEPMVNSKGPGVRVLDDRWTAVTVDGGYSAHFEHSVAVTAEGPWILSELNEIRI